MCIDLMYRNNDNEEQPLLLRLQDLQVRAQQRQGIDSETTASGGQGGRRNWRGIVPYHRVIMSLTQDNVKCLFLARTKTRSRQELDAHNSAIM